MKIFWVVLLCVPILLAHAANKPVGGDPVAMLKDLKDGNSRFVSGKAANCGKYLTDRPKLVEGQAPDAIVLSCSDSRVPPELVFDQGLGELFTLRVAGNVLSNENIAGIEYAVEHLGSRLIVVMGHESCGAIDAALKSSGKKGDAGSQNLDKLIEEIRTNLGTDIRRYAKEADAKLRAPVKANVSAVTTELLKQSKIVRDAVQSGRARVVQGIYELESGRVEFKD